MTAGAFAGCRGGWVRALWDGSVRLDLSRIDRLADVFAAPPSPVTALDTPIGLPERVGAGGRAPERLARPLLGDRQSVLLCVPVRAALAARLAPGLDELARYGAACAAARATSNPPRAGARRCFQLFPQIDAVAALLRARPDLVAMRHGSHPEAACGP